MHTMPVSQLADRQLSTRRSRLICSNNSTRDSAIPDLHAGGIDVKIATKVGQYS
jgi:hypothetical protein